MKIVNWKTEWIIWLAILAPLAYLAYIWPELPEKIPTHWNINNEVDSWGSRASTFILPCIEVFLYFLLVVIPYADPRKENYNDFSRPYFIIRLAITVFLSFLFVVIIQATLGSVIDIGKVVLSGVFLLLAILGKAMTNVKPNYFVGIRTPWTLENEAVWKETHRFGGRFMFYNGLAGCGITLLLPGKWIFLSIVLILIMVLVPVVYSYRVFKKIGKS